MKIIPNFKWVIAGIMITIVVIGFYLFGVEKKANVELVKKTATQEVIIEAQTAVAEKKEESADITDNVVSSVVVKTEQIHNDGKIVETAVAKQLADINKRYATLSATVENEKNKNAEVSHVRISGLWTSYCQVDPTNQHCSTVTPP